MCCFNSMYAISLGFPFSFLLILFSFFLCELCVKRLCGCAHVVDVSWDWWVFPLFISITVGAAAGVSVISAAVRKWLFPGCVSWIRWDSVANAASSRRKRWSFTTNSLKCSLPVGFDKHVLKLECIDARTPSISFTNSLLVAYTTFEIIKAMKTVCVT